MEVSQTLHSLSSLFRDELTLHRLLTQALKQASIRIKVVPFLLHSKRAIESALRQPSPNFALLRVYQAWRSLPIETRNEWKQACRRLLNLQFTSEAQQLLGKCKTRRVKAILGPLRMMIPEYILSESEFEKQPFAIFKFTCLADENVWVQPAACPSDIEPKIVKKLFGRRSAESVVRKLEMIKVCALEYVQDLLSKPVLCMDSGKVIDTSLEEKWEDYRFLRSFESRGDWSPADLLVQLNRLLRAYLEAWDQHLDESMDLKVGVVHSVVSELLQRGFDPTQPCIEVMTVQRGAEVVVLVLQPESGEREVRSLPWGVLLAAL